MNFASIASRRERGAVAVEFALILPVLLVLVFGLIQYGFYFWSMQGASAAVREGARRGAVGQLPDCSDFKSYVEARIGATRDHAYPVSISRSYSTVSGTSVDPEDVAPGDVVTVAVEFRSFDMNFPFVPFINEGVVAQRADSRVEYVPSEPEECA